MLLSEGNRQGKIGTLARVVFQELLEKQAIPKEEIERLKDAAYSRSTFGIYFPLLKVCRKGADLSEQIKVKGRARYWNQVFAGKYLVCSQWAKVSREPMLLGSAHATFDNVIDNFQVSMLAGLIEWHYLLSLGPRLVPTGGES